MLTVLLACSSIAAASSAQPAERAWDDAQLKDRLPTRAHDTVARPPDGEDDRFGDGYETGVVEEHCVSKNDSEGEPHGLCVHWVETTADAPPLTDVDTNDIPDQVDETLDVLDQVWQTEVVEMGFRAPLPDSGPADGQGPDDGTDVYLADVGASGFFGYCAADPGSDELVRAPAYCVLDDDYDEDQFPAPGPSGDDALDIALAHEFFHAIQFAYEFSDADQYLKEGSATWIEDQVFDDVNAHYSYLPESPLLQPEISLAAYDAPNDANDVEYGAWIFWQFLSEHFGGPEVVREVWEATAPKGNKDLSAASALAKIVKNLDPGPCLIQCSPANFDRVFSEFAMWNISYPSVYDEGADYADRLHGVTSPPDSTFVMGGPLGTDSIGRRNLKLAPLSAQQVQFIIVVDERLRLEVSAKKLTGLPWHSGFFDTASAPGNFEFVSLGPEFTRTLPSDVFNYLLIPSNAGTKSQKLKLTGKLTG
ncbi:MAG: hypothetical protein QOI31_3111 [Solirubrobacterales bacterium]|jgi:hypothetical protein|nr:hypothetical protein [Solirubrobacterales bacterium]